MDNQLGLLIVERGIKEEGIAVLIWSWKNHQTNLTGGNSFFGWAVFTRPSSKMDPYNYSLHIVNVTAAKSQHAFTWNNSPVLYLRIGNTQEFVLCFVVNIVPHADGILWRSIHRLWPGIVSFSPPNLSVKEVLAWSTRWQQHCNFMIQDQRFWKWIKCKEMSFVLSGIPQH